MKILCVLTQKIVWVKCRFSTTIVISVTDFRKKHVGTLGIKPATKAWEAYDVTIEQSASLYFGAENASLNVRKALPKIEAVIIKCFA